jgi:hypothetical protein
MKFCKICVRDVDIDIDINIDIDRVLFQCGDKFLGNDEKAKAKAKEKEKHEIEPDKK